LSWGWCPYHATKEILNLQDLDGDGKFKEEFLDKIEGKKIDSVLKSSIYDKNRLFVHWTEFVVS
ncbi:MAG: hypothetical protein JW915_01950, partial [Chitinispirillaceae bacterium]|nr:hypothetical protein [Chitinispirillaceae bacterium]